MARSGPRGCPRQGLSDIERYNGGLPGVLDNTKTPQVWKYEKSTKKLQNHPFLVCPRKYEKNTEKSQNWPEIFLTIFVIFFFGAKPEMGDFRYFFRIFFIFPDLRGFCIL